jgi:hypothetical protein
MLYTEPKTLIVIYKDEILVNQIKKMVETKDDGGEEATVGTKDGSVRIVAWTEKVWLDQKVAGNISSKVLFLGDIKGTDKLVPVIDVKFNDHGVKYGWAGNQAIIHIEPAALQEKEDYDAFLEKLRALPVPEVIKEKGKNSHRLNAKTGQGGKVAVLDSIAILGFNIAMTAKDFFNDKALLKRQMFFYGIVTLYNNDLESFMQ